MLSGFFVFTSACLHGYHLGTQSCGKVSSMKFTHRFSLAGTSIALALATAAYAQDGEQTPTAADPTCELHIWPAENFSSLPFGGIFSDVDTSTDTQFDKLATSELQFDAIKQSDPVKSLGLPADTKVITHAETEADKVTKKRKVRRSQSQSSCYFELHIRSSYLIEDIVWGDRFSTVFEFRKYTGMEEWDLRHRGEGANKLKLFPIKADADPEEVKKTLRDKIGENFLEYAPKAKRKLARKKR